MIEVGAVRRGDDQHFKIEVGLEEMKWLVSLTGACDSLIDVPFVMFVQLCQALEAVGEYNYIESRERAKEAFSALSK